MTAVRDIHPKAPGVAAGVTEHMIRDLVDGFYARVRADDVLGPIFNGAIDDWDHHLDKLCAFWSSVTLMTGRYKGSPMKVHADLSGISSAHFDLWLGLFRQTARELCPPDAAALFIDRAERIAQSLEMGIAVHRGQFVGHGERLVGRAAQPGD
ncbi:preprotein translocase subunit TatC [Hyphomicrobium nitrativorans NL23]|uniref:Preprotein translocase subunit TatC n=1 Tax=Hyphomicrobium nitrativorans NL23 TaxID=1029756 RepID=V5SBW9_9HYPH|nr:group III truncated hemoglobin [Hyphomicrobium nitrativorans]AHB48371.1 preprotein translocase subunit TatC [Hyphomicrobium nitrativorans NL23]